MDIFEQMAAVPDTDKYWIHHTIRELLARGLIHPETQADRVYDLTLTHACIGLECGGIYRAVHLDGNVELVIKELADIACHLDRETGELSGDFWPAFAASPRPEPGESAAPAWQRIAKTVAKHLHVV